MGANMCNSGEQYKPFIQENMHKLSEIVMAEKSKKYIDDKFPKIES